MVREDQLLNSTGKLLKEEHLEATVSTEESHASVIAGAGEEKWADADREDVSGGAQHAEGGARV